MSVSPTLSIANCLVARVDHNSMNLPMKLSSEKQKEIEIVEEGFLDCGAGGKFINQNYARNKGIKLNALREPIRVYNVDGTPNKRGTIQYYVDLKIEIHGRTRNERLLATGLGKHKIILGLPWLRETNPIIDWEKGTLEWRNPKPIDPFDLVRRMARKALDDLKDEKPPEQQDRTPTTISEEPDEEEHLNATQNPLDNNELSLLVSSITGETDSDIWVNAKMSTATEIQAELNLKKKDIPFETEVPKEFQEYLDIFSEEKAARFPEPRSWDHKIEMKDTFVPKSFKTYNLTPEEQVELDKFLKENLEKGYIRPSQSPMASPFFFVGKKDGRLRPCQDYRYLNEHTVKNAYPLPLIGELLDKLKGARRFTKLDIRWGYNNVRIRDGDQWKAAFKTNKGLFEPTVMFFGMCNSPATFQSMMDAIFADMIDDNIVIIYMDDIFIFAPDEITLTENTRRVLTRLRDNDLFLKPTKCEFNKTKVEYLGMVIEEGKISMDSGKLKGIQDWPTPTTVKQVRAFLGFGNFYRRFIWHFSELAKPLNDLLKKDQKFEW